MCFLSAELLIRRARGRRVSPRYVSRRMTELVRELYVVAENVNETLRQRALTFKAARRWRQRFYKRFRVTRKRTNKKAKPLVERIRLWQNHHVALRRYLQTGHQQNETFGRFDRPNRHNVDQVPCPFTFDAASTIEEKEAKTVSIKGCSTVDGDKRFCTLQICCRPTKRNGLVQEFQPKIAIIFRGAGSVYERERPYYYPRSDVYFQTKAWADREFSSAWVRRTFKQHIEERAASENSVPNTMVFCDNLDSQVYQSFLDGLHENNSFRFLLPAGETEMCQPMDAGNGAVIKMILQEKQDE